MARARSGRKPAPFPSRAEIVAYLHDNPGAGRRDVARAFGLDGGQKAHLRDILGKLEDEGVVASRRSARRRRGAMPGVTVLEVSGTDADGEVQARPADWDGPTPAPVVFMAPERRGRPALGAGDRVLARLTRLPDGSWEGRTMRRLPTAPRTVLGVYAVVDGAGRLRPTDRRARYDVAVAAEDSLGAEPGDLMRATVLPGRRLGLRHGRIVERLEKADDMASISLLAIHEHGLVTEFSPAALAEAAAEPAPADGRADLRDVALVTIDGDDARDFDDAVWAEADAGGGWHAMVAIADVAHYVRPGSALDAAAFERGNSAYFPDRVVPMLPAALSEGWCSLVPGEDRPCLAAELWIDADGTLRRHRVRRALMRSSARLTYDQVQAARDGAADADIGALTEDVIAPLYGVFDALAAARRRRGVLELDMPERRVVLDDAGAVAAIETRRRHDSHRLIEELMVTANVAAAETLEQRRRPCMYRIHDAPPEEKLESLRTVLDGIGLKLARGQAVQASHFNRILAQVADTDDARLVHEMVLRTQAQAAYAPANIGHFGLALKRYAHFTSPIRRYADLLVHRALIDGLGLGAGGLAEGGPDFADAAEHVSMTERRAATAERDALDRFTAAYLAERVGTTVSGRITGVTRFGLFVSLDETGGDGIVPMRTLPADSYAHDAARQVLRGRRTGRSWRLGEAVEVRLAEADPLTGGLVLELLDGGTPAAGARRRGRRRG